jgi:hypothetical protein
MFYAWTCLCEEFADQEASVLYLQSQYISVYPQWAKHATRRYLNKGNPPQCKARALTTGSRAT